MANENMQMSAGGYADLRVSEGAVMRYYNDIANNCTFGVGTLVHNGVCTAEELRTPVTQAQVNAQLTARVQVAERAVRAGVPDVQLTQAQFDSLVSFVYNVGAGGAATTLAAANANTPQQVVARMQQHVYVHPRDANGRRLPAVRVQGLVNRRQREVVPFQQPPQQQPAPPPQQRQPAPPQRR
jgi:lysozyme